MKRIITALLVAFMPFIANAGGSSGVSTLVGVQVDPGDGVIVMYGASNWVNPDGCGLTNLVVIPMSNPNYRDVLAAVLTASATGKAISFWLSGCASTNWGGTAPIVSAVTIN